MDKALKKLFAKLDELGTRIQSLEALEKRLAALDTNGQLDSIKEQMGSIKEQMVIVAANSQVVVNTVESHGDTIGKLEKTLTRLDLRCPLMKPDTGEFPEISERLRLKDE